jgi:predicted RNase H-like HicB family nuclease
MRYAIVMTRTNGSYLAHVPDLPGCVARGATLSGVQREIAEAIRLHIEAMERDGQPVPAPSTLACYVET